MFGPLFILVCLVLWKASSGQAADPVKIVIFVETLCSYSKKFIKDQLAPTYAELGDIMAVDIFTYGFALEFPTKGSYKFICHHGPRECQGNKILACARSYITFHSVYVDFAICVMSDKDPPSAGRKCAKLVGFDFAPIEACQLSVEGEYLLHNIGIIQNSLKPAVDVVPWVIINGVHNGNKIPAATTNLKGVVCTTYTGTPPDTCFIKPNKL